MKKIFYVTSKCLFILVFSFLEISCSSFKKNQEEATLHYSIGSSYYQNSSYPQALKEFLIAENLDSENKNIQNSLGLTYFMREKYNLSIKHFKRAISLDPKFTDARNNLARAYSEVGKYSEANKEIQIVLADLTYTAIDRAYNNLGYNYFKQGQFEKAKDAFKKAILNKQDNCYSHNFLGRSYFELHQYSEATSALDKAIGYCQKNLIDEPHYFSAL
ncbi:MAG: tetratricopeptide repeat protein, partial [Bdellovibrionales bacterium]|nr:tetratricopeptide repeat protein [Bdellovibrionales bacterium]